MEKYSKLKKWLLAIAIFSGSGLGLIVSPIVQTLALDYPKVPMSTIRLITTIPSLVSSILGLFLASLVGKKIPYKVALIIGTALTFIGGIMPVVWNSTFTAILISRVIYGFGFSVFAMRNPIITKAFGTKESAMWIGYGMTIGNIFSVITQVVSGMLGDIDWRLSFMLHGICIPMLLLLVVIFKEPEAVVDAAPSSKTKIKGKFNHYVLIYALITLIGCLCAYPILSSISVYIYERNLGTATAASLASSAYVAGGAIAGAIFGRVYAKYSRWLVSAGAAIAVLGYIAALNAISGPMLAILGSGLVGFGYIGGIMLTTIKWAGEASDEGSRPLAMTLISFAVSTGSFVSSYFMIFAKKAGSIIPLYETEIEKTFLVGIIIFAVFVVLNMVVDLRPIKKDAEKQKETISTKEKEDMQC